MKESKVRRLKQNLEKFRGWVLNFSLYFINTEAKLTILGYYIVNTTVTVLQ